MSTLKGQPEAFPENIVPLTEKEMKVIEQLLNGASNKEIAVSLGITVYLKNIYPVFTEN